MIKHKYLIPIIAIIGITTLFFFPEPETNFLLYAGTALFFIIILVLVTRGYRRKK